MDGAFYYDQYLKIKRSFINADLFYVHTRTGIFSNMMITEMPHEESPAQYDTIAVALKLVEVLLVEAQFAPLPASKVKDPTNQSTKDKGIANSKTASPESTAKVKKSAAASLYDWGAS